jgi:hypothetical protein
MEARTLLKKIVIEGKSADGGEGCEETATTIKLSAYIYIYIYMIE